MDPYRFLPFATKTVMKAWADREVAPDVPAWTPVVKPLDESRVALLSTAGIALRTDEPFDQQRERDDPWRSDSSWRIIPADATAEDVALYHLHIDCRPAEADLDVVLPLRRLRELADKGVVGSVADHHYSIMGYVLDATDLVDATAPEISAALAEDHVDLVLLVPV